MLQHKSNGMYQMLTNLSFI